MKKNIYMVQVDTTMGYRNQKVVYLPYAVGLLVSSAWRDATVRDNYTFKDFIFIRDDIEKIVDKMDCPGIVGFSCYCWNTEFNKSLAKAIKERYPDCVTIFGGHNVPDNCSFLEKFSYIDILMHGEGEEPFRRLLAGLVDGDISSTPNISYRNGEELVTTETVYFDTVDVPSPYLDGLFDNILKSNPDISFNAILETSRGCPYHCAYCDWGMMNAKPRLFPLDRILKEINWFSENKIAFIWGADANFGINKRDVAIVEELARVKKNTGYPERMRINYAKNNPERVFHIVKRLKECDFDRLGATLSFQSLNPVVLDNIGRKNMKPEMFLDWVKRYNREDMKVYSELILGLPGETYQSFISGIGKLFEWNQHQMYEVYYCNVLPNSTLGQKAYLDRFGIKTVDVEMFRPHSKTSENIVTEYCTIVSETNTLSNAEWVRAMTYSEMVRAFHSYGFLRSFSIYLFHECNVKYEIFYDRLFDYLEQNTDMSISSLYFKIKRHFYKTSHGHDDENMTYPLTGEGLWQDCEYSTIWILDNFDVFYSEIIPYLKSYDIPQKVFDDLLLYQQSLLRRPGKTECNFNLEYDVYSYLNGVYNGEYSPLQRKANRVLLHDTEVYDDWSEFSQKIIWYGRLGWKSDMNEIDIEYINE